MNYYCKPSTFFSNHHPRHCSYPPIFSRQTLRWLFIFFLCLVPPSSKCLFHFQESTNRAQNYISVLLWLYSSSHLFGIFPLWGTVTSRLSLHTPTSLWCCLPSCPHARSHLSILSKFTWLLAQSFSPCLCLNCKQKKKKAKIRNWNVCVEEVKPQHYPHTVF